ncbi:hypothetical protein H5410_031089 [Solanum commersonii]|uniref:Uncharacterized protein n=1 Tax=Solanum commersonii TaxID=4109 RepID=A0A9J5YIV2_SOLCO|nr:hypothetical protein H5410_031089 [Solanum commersonii]
MCLWSNARDQQAGTIARRPNKPLSRPLTYMFSPINRLDNEIPYLWHNKVKNSTLDVQFYGHVYVTHGTKPCSGKFTNSISIQYADNNMQSHLQSNANGQHTKAGNSFIQRKELVPRKTEGNSNPNSIGKQP